MPNLEKVINDKPDRLVGRHPILSIEALEAHGQGIAAQAALAAKVEVSVEIAEGQFAQGAVYRLAPAASGIIRLGDGSPAAILAKDSDHVVGIVFSFEIEQ